MAFYTGVGVVEDEGQAVKYFHMASDDGHLGVSYLLGDCLLDEFGMEKDQARLWKDSFQQQNVVIKERKHTS
jgi:TPR repeat protein